MLGGRWRIERNPLIDLLTARESGAVREVIVAAVGKQVVGMACVEADPETREGYIVALAVLPLVQRRGIGTGLVNTAMQVFKQYGVEHVTLGQGSPRIWPGVPQPEYAAFPFFEKLGWQFGSVTYDVFADLRSYATPANLTPPQGLRFVTANQGLLPAVLAFHRREFPQWVANYRYVAELGDLNDILVALNAEEEVVGSVITYSQRSHPSRRDVIWQEEFGLDLTAISAIGMAPGYDSHRAMLSLTARATELLKWQGAAFAFIGATPDPTLLEQLGYKQWYAYTHASRDV